MVRTREAIGQMWLRSRTGRRWRRQLQRRRSSRSGTSPKARPAQPPAAPPGARSSRFSRHFPTGPLRAFLRGGHRVNTMGISSGLSPDGLMRSSARLTIRIGWPMSRTKSSPTSPMPPACSNEVDRLGNRAAMLDLSLERLDHAPAASEHFGHLGMALAQLFPDLRLLSLQRLQLGRPLLNEDIRKDGRKGIECIRSFWIAHNCLCSACFSMRSVLARVTAALRSASFYTTMLCRSFIDTASCFSRYRCSVPERVAAAEPGGTGRIDR